MIFAVAVVALAATLSGGAATTSAVRIASPGDAADSVKGALGGTHDTHLLVKRWTPTFARQTRLSCTVCHLGGFPQLSRFGRLFKLNGYTLSNLPAVPDQSDSTNRPSLALSTIPGLSTMAIVSATSTAKALPGTPDTRAEFPQQISLLFGGEIAPHLGALAELSYSDLTSKVSIDNTDVRFANHTKLSGRDLLYGVTLHNNPTVQDVWNTAPAWSYPFTSAALAPRPAAVTKLDGGLAQSVLGLGAYGWFDNMLYAELTAYASAPQGPRGLIDSTSRAMRGLSPYWRVALQNRHGPTYFMLGTYGMVTDIDRGAGSSLSGSVFDRYTDVGGDAQVERAVDRSFLVARASYTHESQDLARLFTASPRGASNATNTLETFRLNATYGPVSNWSFGAGYFATSGSSDPLLYPSASVTGSRTGDPGSNGEVAEVTLNPWLNARVGLQYVIYQRFNGGSTSYDLVRGGRNATDNNTLFLYFWFAY
jgi:hypothetical protein